MFSEMNLGRVPTGYLLDYAIETAALHNYEGTLTDHRSILVRHVELRDSVYVQTLTEEDMAIFGITESERAFGDSYLVQLNELLKQQ